MVQSNLEVSKESVANSISEIVNIISHVFWSFRKSDLIVLLSDIGIKNSNIRKTMDAAKYHRNPKLRCERETDHISYSAKGRGG